MTPEDRKIPLDKIDLSVSAGMKDPGEMPGFGSHFSRVSTAFVQLGFAVVGPVMIFKPDSAFVQIAGGFLGLLAGIGLIFFVLQVHRERHLALKKRSKYSENRITPPIENEIRQFARLTNKSTRQNLVRAAKHRARVDGNIYRGVNSGALQVRSEAIYGVEAENYDYPVDGSIQNLNGQAFVFYAAFLVGLFGACVAAYGVLSTRYPLALTGITLASLGFVALACALLSAEDASEAV